ncbi:MAG TPA: potassium-transporting ATPase subunit KdpA [Gemmatimonadaceae bacterium]|jgi:K+-transporting ATPase ATPase A chain
MTSNGWVQILLYSLVLLLITKPVGMYVTRVYDGSFHFLGAIERVIYRLCRITADEDQPWLAYLGGVMLFSAASMLTTYAALRMQSFLPLNPQHLVGVVSHQAFETAASFTSNTNWQSYAGETTMSYLSQMMQLTFHNFASAAVGMCVAAALIRGIARHSGGRLGNFWADLVRGTLYLFLPGSLVIALFFVQQGVLQNLHSYISVTTIEGIRQVLAMGPVASQEAIKQLGTNGGGFFNANAAHPFENPTPLTNFVQMIAIFAIPAGVTYWFGSAVKRQRHGWAIWAAMFILFISGTAITYHAEAAGNPIHAARGIEVQATSAGVAQSGGNMEGKEVRFGIASSALYATVTTDASCGAVNAMLDSFTPIGGLVPLVNMQLGELIFGGVGAGLYGMLHMVILTVFIAGLMVGRTPEYIGKKIQSREIRMVMLYSLAAPIVILGLTGVAVTLPAGLHGLNNGGPHGLSELLYAFTSTFANNGSAFAGLSGGTAFYNTALGVSMLVGRFILIVPTLALAGFLSEHRAAPESAGTFPVDTPLFVGLLIGVILVIGALTFFPVLSLGPVVEHYLMASGRLF